MKRKGRVAFAKMESRPFATVGAFSYTFPSAFLSIPFSMVFASLHHALYLFRTYTHHADGCLGNRPKIRTIELNFSKNISLEGKRIKSFPFKDNPVLMYHRGEKDSKRDRLKFPIVQSKSFPPPPLQSS